MVTSWERLTFLFSCMRSLFVVLLLFCMVSLVKLGYRLLIFAFFLTYIKKRCGPFIFSAGNHHSEMIRVVSVLLYFYLLSCKYSIFKRDFKCPVYVGLLLDRKMNIMFYSFGIFVDVISFRDTFFFSFYPSC